MDPIRDSPHLAQIIVCRIGRQSKKQSTITAPINQKKKGVPHAHAFRTSNIMKQLAAI
jgi:hypothetical protein